MRVQASGCCSPPYRTCQRRPCPLSALPFHVACCDLCTSGSTRWRPLAACTIGQTTSPVHLPGMVFSIARRSGCPSDSTWRRVKHHGCSIWRQPAGLNTCALRSHFKNARTSSRECCQAGEANALGKPHAAILRCLAGSSWARWRLGPPW